eukprot:278696_1
MRKFVNIRNKHINIQQQKTLCNSYFHDMLQGQQQSYSEQHLQLCIAVVATYIFAPIHDKSLKTNKCLHVTEYAKPKNIEMLQEGPFYRQIGVDKYEGPYWCGKSNVYKLDVTYYQWEEIYSVALQKIFSRRDHLQLHEYIAYNAWKWGHKFASFWKTICKRVSSNILYGC